MTAANVPAGEAPLGDLVAPEPEERPDLWPCTARRGVNGALSVGGRTLIGRRRPPPPHVQRLRIPSKWPP